MFIDSLVEPYYKVLSFLYFLLGVLCKCFTIWYLLKLRIWWPIHNLANRAAPYRLTAPLQSRIKWTMWGRLESTEAKDTAHYSYSIQCGFTQQRPNWVSPRGPAIVRVLSGCMMSWSPNFQEVLPLFTCRWIFNLKMHENAIKYSSDMAKKRAKSNSIFTTSFEEQEN